MLKWKRSWEVLRIGDQPSSEWLGVKWALNHGFSLNGLGPGLLIFRQQLFWHINQTPGVSQIKVAPLHRVAERNKYPPPPPPPPQKYYSSVYKRKGKNKHHNFKHPTTVPPTRNIFESNQAQG